MTNPFTPEIVAWAQAAQAKYQIPASLNLSAAKLESNLGAATPPGTNNWHGIKDPHNTSETATKEQRADGSWYTIQAGFRVFASPADSFMYYGHLLGLGTPYHDIVTAFLKSPRAAADVAALSHALTGVYATAKNYGEALVEIQQSFNLYQYDQIPAVAPLAPPQAPAKPVSPAAPAGKTGGVGTISMAQQTFNMQELFQFLQDIPFDQIAAAAAAGGTNIPADIAAAEAVMASLIKHFFSGGSAASAAPVAAAAAGVSTK